LIGSNIKIAIFFVLTVISPTYINEKMRFKMLNKVIDKNSFNKKHTFCLKKIDSKSLCKMRKRKEEHCFNQVMTSSVSFATIANARVAR